MIPNKYMFHCFTRNKFLTLSILLLSLSVNDCVLTVFFIPSLTFLSDKEFKRSNGRYRYIGERKGFTIYVFRP